MYEKFKEDVRKFADGYSCSCDYDTGFYYSCPHTSVHFKNIKQSYLNAIDVMISRLEIKIQEFIKSTDGDWVGVLGVLNTEQKILKEQRKLIENYEA